MQDNLEVKEYSAFPGLKEAVQKLKVEKPVEQKAETPASPVEPKEISNPGTEAVKQSETASNEPKEQPKAEQQAQVETPTVETPWDADSTEPSTPTSQSYDFTKLGSALKLDGIKSETDLVTKFNELQTKLQESETKKAATFEGVPDELKEVIDLAKSGVDWKSYLGASTVDWKSIDPIDLFEMEFARLPQYRNPDGTLNQQALDDALDAIPEPSKSYEGQRLIQQRLHEQQQLKEQKIAQARLRKEQADKELINATKNLSEILPESQYGVKFESKHSDHLFKGISSGELLQKHLLSDSGQYDMKKVARVIALAEYADKMVKFASEKAKVAGKKEILTTTQNVQLDTPGTSVAPDDESKKVVSVADKFKNYLGQQKSVGHL